MKDSSANNRKTGINITQKASEYWNRFEAWVGSWLTPKRLYYTLLILFLVSLIPLIWIGFYNYPSADDYSIGSECRQTFLTTGSLLSTIGTGIECAVDDWLTWMGYFTSNFLMAMPTNTFGERAYVFTAILMIGMLSASTAYLLHIIFRKVFRADRYLSGSVICMMLFITIQRMQGRVEAFYWYAGAANYILIHSLCMFFYGLMISAVYSSGKKRVWKLVLASILGFLVGGGNQMTALNGAVVMLVAVAFLSLQKKWKQYKAFLWPIGFFYMGFILNVAAPGNWVRAASANGMNPVKAILISFYYTFDYCVNDWSGWPVLLLVLLLIPLFWHMAEKTAFTFPCPIAVILFGYCVVSAMMTPPLFAVGGIGAARLQALTYTMYILVLTLCTGYATGYARKKLEALRQNAKPQTHGMRFSGFTAAYILLLLLLFAFASGLSVVPEPHFFSFSSAITDLANGTAQAYGAAREERLAIYESSKPGDDVVVERIDAQPALLYFSDIQEDTGYWENRGLCKFYLFNSVRIGETK